MPYKEKHCDNSVRTSWVFIEVKSVQDIRNLEWSSVMIKASIRFPSMLNGPLMSICHISFGCSALKYFHSRFPPGGKPFRRCFLRTLLMLCLLSRIRFHLVPKNTLQKVSYIRWRRAKYYFYPLWTPAERISQYYDGVFNLLCDFLMNCMRSSRFIPIAFPSRVMCSFHPSPYSPSAYLKHLRDFIHGASSFSGFHNEASYLRCATSHPFIPMWCMMGGGIQCFFKMLQMSLYFTVREL